MKPRRVKKKSTIASCVLTSSPYWKMMLASEYSIRERGKTRKENRVKKAANPERDAQLNWLCLMNDESFKGDI